MRWVGLGRTGRGCAFLKKIFQLTLFSIAIPCVHPSVIFPHIVLKRLKMSSYFLQHTVAQSLPVYFFHTKQLCESWTGTPYGVVEYRWGK